MPELLVEKHGRATVFTLNRPEARNALSQTMADDLAAAIRELNADPEQYVGIVTGAGDKAFCSGGDLKNMAGEAASGTKFPVNPWPDIAGVSDSEKPILCAVNGVAVAGGFEMALSCDIRIASTTAWFGVFEVKWGIIAGIAAQLLPRLGPVGTAMDLLLSGERLTAEEAHRLGIVQKVVEPGQLMDAALAKADMIARNSQPAVWGTKKIIKFWRDILLAEQQTLYEATIHRVLLSGDVHEGPKAFAEKRAPTFRNRWPQP
jgi:enoyl-CoA hydratase/carnithine racemase